MIPAAADAVPIGSGIETGSFGSHDFEIDPITHEHEAHWSWVATPPTDAPSVTSISYFLHAGGHAGAGLTPAQVADVHAAAAVWNDSGANLVLSAAASDAAADIHVHMDTTSGCGVPIGCAEFTFVTGHDALTYGDGHPQHEMASNTLSPLIQELTMYDDSTFGGSWYSGPAGGIGASDLDFLTVAIQEFGHHLGLAHNDAAAGHPDFGSSPMNGGLPSGTTRRVLVAADTAAITHLYGAVAVPEPSSGFLVGTGVLGLLSLGARRR
jgi:hypothetical protein